LIGVPRVRRLVANKLSEADGLTIFDARRRNERSARRRSMRKRCVPKDVWIIVKDCERTSARGSVRKIYDVQEKPTIEERQQRSANEMPIA
jgi:hypothetical protein